MESPFSSPITRKRDTNPPQSPTQRKPFVHTAEFKDENKRLYRIFHSEDRYTGVTVKKDDPFFRVLEEVCKRRRLPVDEYYLIGSDNGETIIPRLGAKVDGVDRDVAYYLRQKTVFEFTHRRNETPRGIGVLGLDPETNRKCLYVDSVQTGGAMAEFLAPGDHILMVNGLVCARSRFLDLVEALRREEITCVVATKRQIKEGPSLRLVSFDFEANAEHRTIFLKEKDIDELGCPPPPGLMQTVPEHPPMRLPVATSLPPKLDPIPLEDQARLRDAVSSLLARLDILLGECDGLAGKGPEGMRLRVLQELIETEKAYVADLTTLINHWLTPLDAVIWLGEDEKEILRSNAREILAFHTELMTYLQPAVERELAGGKERGAMEVIAGHREGFMLYARYCTTYERAKDVLERHKESTPAFNTFLVEQNPTQQQSTSLDSFLIKPVQRILKYPLLAREIQKNTDSSHPTRPHVDRALEVLKEVTSKTNEIKREQDNATKASELFSYLDAGDETVNLAALGRLRYFGTVILQSSTGKKGEREQCEGFLFEKEILFCRRDVKAALAPASAKKEKEKEKETKIGKSLVVTYKLKERLVINHLTFCSTEGDTAGRFVWSVSDNQTTLRKKAGGEDRFLKRITVECRSAEERDYWVEKLTSLFKEVAREKVEDKERKKKDRREGESEGSANGREDVKA